MNILFSNGLRTFDNGLPRVEILNAADRHAVDIGAQAGRAHNIIGGDRKANIRVVDDIALVRDATGVMRSANPLENMAKIAAQAALFGHWMISTQMQS